MLIAGMRVRSSTGTRWVVSLTARPATHLELHETTMRVAGIVHKDLRGSARSSSELTARRDVTRQRVEVLFEVGPLLLGGLLEVDGVRAVLRVGRGLLELLRQPLQLLGVAADEEDGEALGRELGAELLTELSN